MKCEACQNMRYYTLAQDECGAGSTILYCTKGHWENTLIEPFETEKLTQDVIDLYEKCKDYKIRDKK
jgi:hypothetical protein